jgi:hypothetical protein
MPPPTSTGVGSWVLVEFSTAQRRRVFRSAIVVGVLQVMVVQKGDEVVLLRAMSLG